MTNSTIFSTGEFIRILETVFKGQLRGFSIPVKGSGHPRVMHGVFAPGRFKTRYVSLGPFYLPASPDWVGELDPGTVKAILSRLQSLRVRHFVWNVRFDHGPLAACLESLGLKPTSTSTHVLYLDREYSEVFAGYNATLRNHIRKGARRGLIVRDSDAPEDVYAYYDVYMQLVKRKQAQEGFGYIYPVDFFLELAMLKGAVRFLVAEWQGKIVGGSVFFRDGCSVRYFHGASDREHSFLFPLCGLLDHAIRWGFEWSANSFNFGGSAGIPSLEQFKSSWGALPHPEWSFEWSNPFWERLSHFKNLVRRAE